MKLIQIFGHAHRLGMRHLSHSLPSFFIPWRATPGPSQTVGYFSIGKKSQSDMAFFSYLANNGEYGLKSPFLPQKSLVYRECFTTM